MVPFNASLLLTDILASSPGKWIIVSRHYLGSINHTLLSVEFLKQRGFYIKGIIFNGTPLPGSEEFILTHTQLPCLGRLRQEHELTPAIIKEYAQAWKAYLQEI
jgi:dethiobiotin synthetase